MKQAKNSRVITFFIIRSNLSKQISKNYLEYAMRFNVEIDNAMQEIQAFRAYAEAVFHLLFIGFCDRLS